MKLCSVLCGSLDGRGVSGGEWILKHEHLESVSHERSHSIKELEHHNKG